MLVLTDHGLKRARKRLGLSRRAALRTAEKAWLHGYQPRHISALADTRVAGSDGSDGVRVWGDHVWVFEASVDAIRLITVYPIKAAALVEGRARDQRGFECRLEGRRRLRQIAALRSQVTSAPGANAGAVPEEQRP